MKNCSTAVVLAVASLLAIEAHAQRREGESALANLEVTLETSTKFGTQRLAPGRYRLSLVGDTLVLFQARAMVEAARLETDQKPLGQPVSQASAKVTRRRSSVEIRVRVGEREYVARGTVVAKKAEKGPSIDLASRKGGFGVTGGIPDKKSELELIEGALGRYEKDVKHCADQAQKNRWTTDHPRFRRCVCPLTEKWRLPKVQKATRIHRMLAKRRSGYSITVTDAGKVADCRVWIGSKPPPDEKTAQASPKREGGE